MALTEQDLTDKIDMLNDDVKSLRKLLEKLNIDPDGDKQFTKLSLEKKLLAMNAELLQVAKQAGISLPR